MRVGGSLMGIGLGLALRVFINQQESDLRLLKEGLSMKVSSSSSETVTFEKSLDFNS